jgi:CheY-like chemotaxis protein
VQILVADDNIFYRRMLEATLAGWGFEVLPACDGQEAWRLLQTMTGPRLLLLDWVMPHMDGLQLCWRIRSMPAGMPPTFIILLTAKGGKENIIRALQSGADDFIQKPISHEALYTRLVVALSKLQPSALESLAGLQPDALPLVLPAL